MRYSTNSQYAAAEEMVDISGSYRRDSSSGSRYAESESGGKNNKNKIIIISIIAGAVIALGVAGFCIFNAFNGGEDKPTTNAAGEFVFAEKTYVSGVDISGKTMKEAKALLEQNKASFVKPIKFSINIAGTDVVLDQSKFEYTYNIDEVLAKVKSDADAKVATSKQEYTVDAKVTPASIESNVSAICEEHNTKAVNAYVSKFHPYSDNRFEFVNEQPGFEIDSANLKSQITSSFGADKSYIKLDAVTTETTPEVTAAFLKDNLVKLGSYDTVSYNTENGTTNMRVSLAACNGSIIDPGETWSFNECTGDSNLESNGYKSAHVISEGKIIDGIGGGICQSSSTIYNAAIRSDMEIVERYNHKWASAYVPSGLDATIDYPNLDLKLKNVSGYQMFLECKEDGGTLYATFWGYQDPSYDEIKTENQMGESSSSSYSVNAWRIYYKDGKEVKREELPSSRYDTDNGSGFYADDDNDSGSDDSSSSNSGSGSGAQSSAAQQSSQTEQVDNTPQQTSQDTGVDQQPDVQESVAQVDVSQGGSGETP